MSLLQNSEAEEAGINPAPTKTHVGEGFIPSLPNCCFIDETPLQGFLQDAQILKNPPTVPLETFVGGSFRARHHDVSEPGEAQLAGGLAQFPPSASIRSSRSRRHCRAAWRTFQAQSRTTPSSNMQLSCKHSSLCSSASSRSSADSLNASDMWSWHATESLQCRPTSDGLYSVHVKQGPYQHTEIH